MEETERLVAAFTSTSTHLLNTSNDMVRDWWRNVSAAFWSTDFWLPDGITWQDVHTSAGDVWLYPILFCFMFLSLRYCFIEPFVLVPLARSRGIQNTRPTPPRTNALLETIYGQHQTRAPKVVVSWACRSTGQTVRQVERWLRRKHALTYPNNHHKFLDCGFKLLCHTGFGILGAAVTLPKPWLWDTSLCWKDFPNHEVTSDVFWYYMIILGYYWAITLVELPQPGSQDSNKSQMILHHTLTILLIVFSWTCGFIRIGILILFIHEYSDIALLAAKMCKYAKYDAVCEQLFVAFLVLWILTRCCVLPFWIARSVFFESTEWQVMPAIYVFQFWFGSLLLLTGMWTVLVVKTMVRKISGGGLHDVRSSSEQSDIASEDDKKTN
ncbi:ceramide synthase 2-like [Procambarus clarkii]|uniref:ceramide synthase 2-like n=1 Tax=Procambarus clarkii TaxID=6728 RepID=UPI00374381C6